MHAASQHPQWGAAHPRSHLALLGGILEQSYLKERHQNESKQEVTLEAGGADPGTERAQPQTDTVLGKQT